MSRALQCLSSVIGALLLLSNAAWADGDPARGQQRFVECAACHSLERGVNNVGPTLHEIFDRKAGTLPDFRFSPAMKRSGIIWTAQTLDAYLADPQKAIPANRMPYAGMTDARDRDDLIAYLLKASK